jgi:hypothetical protein
MGAWKPPTNDCGATSDFPKQTMATENKIPARNKTPGEKKKTEAGTDVPGPV